VSVIRPDTPIQFLKGVGPAKGTAFIERGIITVNDLLYYFPRKYLDRTTVTPIAKLSVGRSATIVGRVRAHGLLHSKRKMYEVILEDSSGAITLVWFGGIRFVEKLFKRDDIFAATGVPGFYNGFRIIHPDMERLEEESDKMIHAGRIVPVYPQTAELSKVGLTSKVVRRITTTLFEAMTFPVPDYLPKSETAKLKLLPLHNALHKMHYPETAEDIERARRRLAFDELLGFQFLVQRTRGEKLRTIKKRRFVDSAPIFDEFSTHLPFTLTGGQKKSLNEIAVDLHSSHPMMRLLQGDVGCGKTVVAVMSALLAAKSGFQVGFMAPTEILAQQHYRTWRTPLEEAGVASGVLVSGMKSAERKKVIAGTLSGEIGILFGTHALIYDQVKFANLGLVIIDEQHRFGVEQRGRLHAKGDNPDLLVMTATPIPRTLALTLYGDLDISTIEGMPPGRQPIRSVWRTSDVKDKVYAYVRDQIQKDGQAYIVFPLIEKSEDLPLESIEDAAKELRDGAFRNCQVGIVHGKLKSAERDATLEEFRAGRVKILIATTVIEVGIDNPNANLLVIQNAERFGLSQLHQLRGRIGRGAKKSTVIALAGEPISDYARRRLEYFVEHSDGFNIAEADLELRGPGEIYGLRQSGVAGFRSVRLSTDRDLIESSRELLMRVLADKAEKTGIYKDLYAYLFNHAADRVSIEGG
jgi:ATP-dependent DNA helicase RecG